MSEKRQSLLPLALPPNAPKVQTVRFDLLRDILNSETPQSLQPGDMESKLSLSGFRRVASATMKAKKCIAITGAGISVSAGIPDFRSTDGLYNLVKNRYPNAVVKGKDLFDASLFRDAESTRLFYAFISELKLRCDAAEVTPTHRFLKRLHDEGKLVRWYTQNIDCFEARTPSNTDSKHLSTPPPSQHRDAENVSAMSAKGKGRSSPPFLVPLHGDLATVRCTACPAIYPFDRTIALQFADGDPPACPSCATASANRVAAGRRAMFVGTLRPNIVLYGEHQSSSDDIGKVSRSDERSPPSVLLVLGTSLKVDGVRRLVKDLGARVRARGGLVVLINRDWLGAAWEKVFDVFLMGDCDDVVTGIAAEMERSRNNRGKENQSTLDAFFTVESPSSSRKPAPVAPSSPTKKQRTLLLDLSVSNAMSPNRNLPPAATSKNLAPATPVSASFASAKVENQVRTKLIKTPKAAKDGPDTPGTEKRRSSARLANI